MAAWRRTAASAVAVSAVIFSGQAAGATASPVTVTQDSGQELRSATRMAAQTYRQQRRRILGSYREASMQADSRLRAAMGEAETVAERQAAWRAYSDETAASRAAAQVAMRDARATFRDSVQRARGLFTGATPHAPWAAPPRRS